jgi:hypothetical protein
MHQAAVQILKATVGIEASLSGLLPRLPLGVEVSSLLTDFRDVVEIPFSPRCDGRIILQDTGSRKAEFSFVPRVARFRGPLRRLEEKASDIRYGFWGNQGFLYRFALRLLENRHRIFSIHACGLYDEAKHTLYVAAGGAGSGKTVYLLSGIARGLKLFSTETVHFRFEKKGLSWFKGSLVDNIRLGTLLYDFRQFLPAALEPRSDEERKGAWQRKVALDLSEFSASLDEIQSCRLILLFPRIEEGCDRFSLQPWTDRRPAAKALFDNISQKIAETFILDDAVAVPGLDDSALAAARWEASVALAANPSVATIASVLSNPAECWGELLEG